MATHYTQTAPKQTTALPEALANINSNVLDDRTLRKLVDPDVYHAFEACRSTGRPMQKSARNALATSIREWAQARGCIGYSHWFSPLRGPVHGEKLETFMAVDFKTGQLIVNLSGTELFQTETDGSSFPNGGLRVTHEAAAFMGWDTASPPFVYEQTLYIPSSFVSWTGEALDQKTPLLRANDAVNKHALRVLRHLGDSEAQQVISNVGWEQEFFVIENDDYLARPDLVACGRTLIGQTPFRGQEQDANYFGKMPTRVRAFLKEARERMWALGISIDCAHNEVAPGQFEISPIFSRTNLAADGNVLAIEVLNDVAAEHGLRVLCHEKPFAGINGNGKHNNWGLNTDTGANIFEMGKGPQEDRRFIAFVAALLRAVNKHGDLLRCGVSTAGNDHRLGAQEAPPAILTLYVGKSLEAHLKKAAQGGEFTGHSSDDRMISVATTVADIRANAEDRNRTAPFPWCGNRFEFRAVGGNQHIAFPLAMVNSAVAEALKHMADEIDGGKKVDEVIRETLRENQGALFSGNGYSDELYEFAERNQLFHLQSSPDAYAEFTSPKNIKLFEDLGVFNEREVIARQAVLLEAFATEIHIEARTLLGMLQTRILPAVMQDVKSDADSGFSSALLDEKRTLVQSLLEATQALAASYEGLPSGDDLMHEARYADRTLRTAIQDARKIVDELEGRVDRRRWPLPTYDDLLRRH